MAKTVLLTGGTGLIGTRIVEKLLQQGDSVHLLTRSERENQKNKKYFKWDLHKKYIDPAAFDGVDSVIHLVGATVAKRWTPKYRGLIISSRVDSANLILDHLKKRGQKIESLISTSASGYYVANTDKINTEEDLPGGSFLAEVCKKWEYAAIKFGDVAEHVMINRVGVVLAKEGGALEKMLPPFKFGLAPYFGNGNQFYPWIHVEDVANQFVYGLNQSLSGIYNANTGNITQKELNTAIAKAMDKKALPIPAPNFALEIAMGEMRKIVTDSVQMSNEKIYGEGFISNFPSIDVALNAILKQ